MRNYDELRQKAEDMIKEMDPALSDTIYRLVWKGHVEEDVASWLEDDERIEDLSDEELKGLVDAVAERHVYGDYDCNLSYWQNLDNLINDELDRSKERE